MKLSISSFLTIFVLFIGFFLTAGALTACDETPKEEPAPEAAATDAPKPQVEVVFVLDSTGSMGGLIEGAKQKIWAIANEIILQKPEPDVKIGLLTYRDLGDEYVTKMMDLTTDVDAIYGFLMPIQANGGGDGPESVNQALDEAVNLMSWTPKEKAVYRVIFLVGDYPPHMDYPNDVKYPETCKKALENNIIINTIQCGNESTCTPIWQEIAQLSEGNYSQIGQTGNVVVLESPFDAEISRLTVELGETVVAYGSEETRDDVRMKLEVSKKAPASAKADRAAFNLYRGGTAVTGTGDLVADMEKNAELLDEVSETSLPEPMREMAPEERQRFVVAQQAKRQEINVKIGELNEKRKEWLATDGKKLRLDMAESAKSGEGGLKMAGKPASGRRASSISALAPPMSSLSGPADISRVAEMKVADVYAYDDADMVMAGEELACEEAEMDAPLAAEPAPAESFDESVSNTITEQFLRAVEK